LKENSTAAFSLNSILGTCKNGMLISPRRLRRDCRSLSISLMCAGKASKFYLFDVGVAGFITRRRIHEKKGPMFSQAFEHFILMQLLAHSSYQELGYSINFWRTKTGLEVDFIIGREAVRWQLKSREPTGWI